MAKVSKDLELKLKTIGVKEGGLYNLTLQDVIVLKTDKKVRFIYKTKEGSVEVKYETFDNLYKKYNIDLKTYFKNRNNPQAKANAAKVLHNELMKVGDEVASLWGGICFDVKVLKSAKKVQFLCKEHGDIFCTELSFDALKKDYGYDIETRLISKSASKDIKTICYGKTQKWQSREKALQYFLDCMINSEGAERERYTNIYLKLKQGYMVCDDT